MSTETLTRKKSVTIPADVADSVAEFSGGASFSAYVTAALRNQIAMDKLRLFAAEANEKWGPIPDGAHEQVLAELAAAKKRRLAKIAATQSR